ncbi:hypothetical protein [Arsenophonus nasoniae]|uniref:Uncharacterized protein n=1 Tax=Arsenophonus nasoniae TaxID=638 RepID=A0AA95GW98_9GAMM|nr:hypothetical protein [Arsenophonus nasoniae]WGM03870.1 hypothetical protein QE210_20530 [Arsenophonus nasoniae]WGM03929.1 hypothetical protein QE210_20820 [Arsenophonus nasoniae]
MRLPNMARTLRRFSQPLTFITEVISTKDFQPDFAITRKSIEGVISSLPDEAINKDSLDWSLEYFTVHVQPQYADLLGVYLEYKGKIFKSINRKDYSDYGYVRYVFEEVKDSEITCRLLKDSPLNYAS